VEYARQIVWAMATGFMPMFSELDGRREQGLIRSIYLSYSRYILLTNLPVLVLIFLVGRPFIALWISPEYAREGGVALLFLAGAALVEGFQPLLWRLFLGVGRLGVLVTVHSLASVATVILSVILIRPYGISGVAAAVFLTTLVAQIVFTVYVSRYLELSVGRLLKEIHLRPVAANLLFTLIMLGVFHRLGTGSYLDLLLGTMLGAGLYAPLTYRLCLTVREREWLRGKLSRMVQRRRATAR
jgi:O-antigen/teichoic acid export membrane protein